jgi:predicted N-acetyltransferase YhbS
VHVTRIAEPDDAPAIAAVLSEAFENYCSWAPSGWAPPVLTEANVARLSDALGRPDVWCLLALDGERVIAHVALSLVTLEDPEPAPTGVVNLWQLFVRPAWHGRGVATEFMTAAVHEASRRGFRRMRLWTPRGQSRARRFYEREGWTLTGGEHEDSPSGLPTVEYARDLD